MDTTGLLTVVIVIAAGTLFFAPSFVAAARDHHNVLAIFVLNILLGWTGLGWAIALVWAFSATQETG